MYVKLDRKFYNKNSIDLAKDLLGKYVFRKIDKSNNKKFKEDKLIIGKIVETEAYMGFYDKGAHTYKGRRTVRTEAMYGEEGHAYVYLIYGMYNCLNVVAAEEGIGQAVLIRGVEPIEGHNEMSYNRYGKPFLDLKKQQIKNMTNGPGKLCGAFDITRVLNGEDLTLDKLYICKNTIEKDGFEIIRAKRIGIDYAEEAIHYLWRFYIKGNAYVSVY